MMTWVVVLATAASAQTTDPAGGNQPFSLGQPGLALTQALSVTGLFPTYSSADSSSMALVHTFAGNFGPDDAPLCDGRLYTLQQNSALFAIIGTTYGGNGTSNFAIPDLGGRFMVGTGNGPGLPLRTTGDVFGAEQATLTASTLPAHAHALVSGGITGFTGQSQQFAIDAPTLTLTPWVAVDGYFPTTGGTTGLTFIGEIRWFAGSYVPDNWMPCDGRLLDVNTYSAAFAIFGTTFGGDGVNTFAVPDLRGRVPVGTGQGAGFSPVVLGQTWGSPYVSLTTAQLATHAHGVPAEAPTATAGLSQSFSAQQPSLGITWLIATQGIYPSRSGSGSFDPDSPYLGELVGFVGDFAPKGWALAAGQILPIQQNTALFSLLGTSFGGNGVNTFALPDLRGRTPVGTSSLLPVGATTGWETLNLLAANLPAHVHTYTPAPVDAGAPDAGDVDAGAPDAGALDAGVSDAGVLDAGVLDAGVLDAGVLDAGVLDAGVLDAGVLDAGVLDAGVLDAGVLDAGELDAGALDAGVLDAGELDAGELDAGELDAGELDAGELDAGELDAGELDAGELDAGATADAGEMDAGALADAGVTTDAGVAGDGGVTADGGSDTPDAPMGCGCSSDGATANFLGAVLVLLARMRRRPRTAR